MHSNYVPPRLTTFDVDVIKIGTSHLDSLLDAEIRKAQRAEDKAMRLLSVCGLGATALAGFASYAHGMGASAAKQAGYWLLATGILLTIKATRSCLAVIEPAHGYQLTDGFVDEIQELDEVKALKKLLNSKLWLYPHMVKFAQKKLYRLYSAIRHVVVLVAVVILLGVANLSEALVNQTLSKASPAVVHLAGFFLLLVAGFLDRIAEERDKLWTRETTE